MVLCKSGFSFSHIEANIVGGVSLQLEQDSKEFQFYKLPCTVKSSKSINIIRKCIQIKSSILPGFRTVGGEFLHLLEYLSLSVKLFEALTMTSSLKKTFI